jgi:predicted PurR-regulated permease PerM
VARVHPRSAPPQARSLFLAGAGLLLFYLFALKPLSGVTDAILLGFAGAVFAVLLDLPAAGLAKRMPRPLAVIIVIVALALTAFLAARWIVPGVAHQFAALASQIPAGLARVWSALRSSSPVARALPERIELSRLGHSAVGQLLPFLSGALSVVTAIGVIIVVGSFLCADPRSDLRLLDALLPERLRPRAHEVILRSVELLRHWIGGTLLSMTIVGLMTSLGLLIVGVHGWLALGLLAFVTTAVPYVGSALLGVAIAGAGLADSGRRALFGLVVFALVQASMSVIQPLIFRSAIRTSPTLLLLFQFIMTASFGALGILLAQPLLAVLTVILETTHDQERGESPPA